MLSLISSIVFSLIIAFKPDAIPKVFSLKWILSKARLEYMFPFLSLFEVNEILPLINVSSRTYLLKKGEYLLIISFISDPLKPERFILPVNKSLSNKEIFILSW